MAILLSFLTILAWVGAVLGGLVLALRIYGAATHTELKELAANMRGKTITYPITVPGLIFLVSVAFLIAKAVS